MPQDPLTQQLIQRVGPQGGQPDVPLPDTPQTPQGLGARVLDGGMDFLTSALGLRKQTAGNVPQALGAMAGILPFGALGSEEGAGSSLLKKIFASNPEAEAVYNRAMTAQAPEVMAAKEAAQKAKYAHNANVHDALLDLDVADRPRMVPTENGHAIPIPINTEQVATTNPVNLGANLNVGTTQMERYGLSPEIIREVRKLGREAALKKYPSLGPATIKSIANGDTWGWVK